MRLRALSQRITGAYIKRHALVFGNILTLDDTPITLDGIPLELS